MQMTTGEAQTPASLGRQPLCDLSRLQGQMDGRAAPDQGHPRTAAITPCLGAA